ncbi:MAG: acyl-CoA dehydrogenase [Methanobacteriota archaeon]|nr:MAG: acyl-CoA dehydrogenase [Euryarchaeota archaeon]
MDFKLTEEQEMIKKMVRDFAEKEIAPLARENDEKSSYPPEIAKKLGELGIMGITIPTEYGGAGTDHVSYAIAIEELSRVDSSFGTVVSVNNSLVCDPILKYGTDEQKKKLLTPIAKHGIGAFSLTEPGSGSDAGSLKCTAVLEGDEYVINGTKNFVSNGLMADLVLLFAVTDKSKGAKGISAFLIPDGTPGFEKGKKEDKLGIRACDTIEISFEDCRIPKEFLLGEEEQGLRIALGTLDGGRIGIAAQAVGIAQGALDESLRYSQEREQFGQPIFNFQAIQWKLANIATETEAARLLVHRAAFTKEQGKRFSTEAAMAKLFASDVAMKATREAIQVFGGYGYVKEYPVERFYRDAKVTEIYEGTSEVQRIVISRALLKD